MVQNQGVGRCDHASLLRTVPQRVGLCAFPSASNGEVRRQWLPTARGRHAAEPLLPHLRVRGWGSSALRAQCLRGGQITATAVG